MSYWFRGKPACECLAKWLPVYEKELLRRKVIRVSLDVYQLIGGSSKSAGTHLPGGAYDIAQRDETAIWVARQMGAAAWDRPTNWDGKGGVGHQHGVLRGCPHNSGGRYQITAYDKGYNGLGSGGMGGLDDGPEVAAVRTWEQGITWAKLHRRKRRAKHLKVMAHNVKVGRETAAIMAAWSPWIRKHRPDVIIGIEAYALAKGKNPIPGYTRHLGGFPGSEQNEIVVFTRDSAATKLFRVAKMKLPWTGPKMGVKHDPRQYPWLAYRKGRTRWRVGGVHFPFGPAKKESVQWSLDWLAQNPTLPAVLVGDQNLGVKELRAAGFEVGVGRGVDNALMSGCELVATEDLGAGGSDHHAILYKFETL